MNNAIDTSNLTVPASKGVISRRKLSMRHAKGYAEARKIVSEGRNLSAKRKENAIPDLAMDSVVPVEAPKPIKRKKIKETKAKPEPTTIELAKVMSKPDLPATAKGARGPGYDERRDDPVMRVSRGREKVRVAPLAPEVAEKWKEANQRESYKPYNCPDDRDTALVCRGQYRGDAGPRATIENHNQDRVPAFWLERMKDPDYNGPELRRYMRVLARMEKRK